MSSTTLFVPATSPSTKPVVPVDLDTVPVSELSGVGPRLTEKLEKLGIHSVYDLLFHLPMRYQDRTRVVPIAALVPGQFAVVDGHPGQCQLQYGKRRSLSCSLQDESGSLKLRFFQFAASQRKNLEQAWRIRAMGEVRRGPRGLEMVHPEYRLVEEGTTLPVEETLTGIYPSTEGISQNQWRKLIDQALTRLRSGGGGLPNLLASLNLPYPMPLDQALPLLHQPPCDADQAALLEGLHPCQRRLALEELIAHQICMRQRRQNYQARPAVPLPSNQAQRETLLQAFGFQLTAAQTRVAAEIENDLARKTATLRLIQGDVGSGKTAVAALAALQALANGGQVAIMAPTEILAEQHLQAFRSWLSNTKYSVGWLSGRSQGVERRETLRALREGAIDLLIGTHALFQAGVEFARLVLVIIDEQHRFGVHQRLSLIEKAQQPPHQLIMTATPIPRTLAMAAFADLDVSVIDELPPGRTPVRTLAMDNQRRGELIERIRQACSDGKQVYWVCTLIEESEELQCQAAEACAAELAQALPDISIGLVHGRLKAAEKQELMDAFKNADTQLLVATTVIEVGVNVPNASLMVIENPERLGLAQLHQLRGRVGRGSVESFCILLYQSPLSRQSRERIGILRDSTDGFYIAEQDLLLRGAGEVLGTRQTGLSQMRVADLVRDTDLLPEAEHAADELLLRDQQAAVAVVQRWIASAERFADV